MGDKKDDRSRSAPTRARPDAVQATLDRIEASWADFLAALDGIPAERIAEPGVSGAWSVKDLMGHVAVWDAHVVAFAKRVLAGEPRTELDWQGLNEREAAARAGRAVAEQRDEMERTHEAMLAFVRGLQPAELRTKGIRPRIRIDTFEHYAEHARDIRSWRQREGV